MQLFRAAGEDMYLHSIIHLIYKSFTTPPIHIYHTLFQESGPLTPPHNNIPKNNLVEIEYNGRPISAIIE